MTDEWSFIVQAPAYQLFAFDDGGSEVRGADVFLVLDANHQRGGLKKGKIIASVYSFSIKEQMPLWLWLLWLLML